MASKLYFRQASVIKDCVDFNTLHERRGEQEHFYSAGWHPLLGGLLYKLTIREHFKEQSNG